MNVVVSEASKGGVEVGGISPHNSPYIMGSLILPTFIPPFGASDCPKADQVVTNQRVVERL